MQGFYDRRIQNKGGVEMITRTFSKQTLDAILEEIVDQALSSDKRIWDVIAYVKVMYTEEINTLQEESSAIFK